MTRIVNMSVGQTELHPVYRRSLTAPIETPAYFTEYRLMYREVEEMMKKLFSTNRTPFVTMGTGRTGLETITYSLISSGNNVLCLDNGHWGHFLGELCENIGAMVDYISSGLGSDIDWKSLEKALVKKTYQFVTVVHCETNTGALYDIARVSSVIKQFSPSTMLIVDGISAFGGTTVEFDNWDIDCYVGGSQKCLNAAQGSPIVCFSERAKSLVDKLKHTRPYLHTLSLTHKPSYLALRGLHSIFTDMINEGLDTVYARHSSAAHGVRAGLLELGLHSFVEDEKLHSPSVTRIVFPSELQDRIDQERRNKGIDQDVVTQTMKNRFGVVIGEDRIGTMGNFARSEYVVLTIEAIGRTLSELGFEIDLGSACAAAARACYR